MGEEDDLTEKIRAFLKQGRETEFYQRGRRVTTKARPYIFRTFGLVFFFAFAAFSIYYIFFGPFRKDTSLLAIVAKTFWLLLLSFMFIKALIYLLRPGSHVRILSAKDSGFGLLSNKRSPSEVAEKKRQQARLEVAVAEAAATKAEAAASEGSEGSEGGSEAQ